MLIKCRTCKQTVSKKASATGPFCSQKCYNHARKPTPDGIDHRFWSKVQKTDGCWIWQAATNQSGYGVFRIRRDSKAFNVLAHRYAYSSQFGSFQSDLFVCHTCDNPPCVNPVHLFLGTHEDNMRDGVHKLRMHPGEKDGLASMTDAQALEIRKMRDVSRLSYKEIAAKAGLSYQAVRRVIRRDTWKHI